MFCRLLIIITFLFLPVITHSGQSPEYNLEVAFDIHNSKITGIATIDVNAGKELALRNGHLKINGITLNQQKISFDVREGILKDLPPQNGSIVIRYEGIFKGDLLKDFTEYVRNASK